MGLEQRNIQHPESTEFPKTRAILTTDGRIVTDRMTNALNAPLFISVHDPFMDRMTNALNVPLFISYSFMFHYSSPTRSCMLVWHERGGRTAVHKMTSNKKSCRQGREGRPVSWRTARPAVPEHKRSSTE
jgi:hypothetical protein